MDVAVGYRIGKGGVRKAKTGLCGGLKVVQVAANSLHSVLDAEFAFLAQ